jgi:hypothetical protein
MQLAWLLLAEMLLLTERLLLLAGLLSLLEWQLLLAWLVLLLVLAELLLLPLGLQMLSFWVLVTVLLLLGLLLKLLFFLPPRPPSCIFAVLSSVRWRGADCSAGAHAGGTAGKVDALAPRRLCAFQKAARLKPGNGGLVAAPMLCVYPC